jgi:NADH/NAD ratio-sensing transcriptional regulator Rex
MDFNGYFKELEREISDLKYEIGELKEELELMKNIKQAPKKKFFSTKEAATFLNINPQTIRNYVYLGKLGCLKGEGLRDLKFNQEHLDDFIKNQLRYKKSDSQLEIEVSTTPYSKSKSRKN